MGVKVKVSSRVTEFSSLRSGEGKDVVKKEQLGRQLRAMTPVLHNQMTNYEFIFYLLYFPCLQCFIWVSKTQHVIKKI